MNTNVKLVTKNLKYYNIDSDGNFLYAATSGGVYRFQKNTNKIPQDFSAWELLGSNFGLPVREFKNIVNHYNHIYAASNDALFKLNDQGTFENLYSDSKYKIQYISAEKQNMYVGLTCFNNCNNKILKWEEDDIYTTIENDCTQKNMHVTEDSEGNLWLADERWGFRIIKPNSTTCDIIYSNGPLSTNFFEILPQRQVCMLLLVGMVALIFLTIEQTAYSNIMKEIGPLLMHFLNPYLRPKNFMICCD